MPSGILPKLLGVVRGLLHGGEDRCPALGGTQAAVLVTTFDPGHAEAVGRGADDAGDLDRDLDLADLAERIERLRVAVQRQRALVGREVVGAKPILADDDRVGRHAAHLLDEAGEMPGDLAVGRLVVGVGGSECLGLAEPVDLHHPGRDGAARRLPYQPERQPADDGQFAERDQAPVFGLHARRADAIVPDGRSALVGCLGARGCARSARRCGGRGSFTRLRKIDRGSGTAAVAGLHGMRDRGHAAVDALAALHAARPGWRTARCAGAIRSCGRLTGGAASDASAGRLEAGAGAGGEPAAEVAGGAAERADDGRFCASLGHAAHPARDSTQARTRR